ncbi:MAG: transcriptional repressor LexA [Synergistaceae bacterium]|nr:transcriptional repressor LexA [Synergistaceae bacterium]
MERISSFAERLKQYREQSELTLSELEVKTGVPAQTLNRYELAQRAPKIDVAINIAAALSINPLWLQGYDTTIRPITLELTPSYLMGRDDSSNSSIPAMDSITGIETQKIPLLGEVAAGVPIYADQNFECYVELGTQVKADFALRVKGDSMVNARIMDGDIVFIRKQPVVGNGEIAAVLIDDEATLKRFYREGDIVTLFAENTAYPPRIINLNEAADIRILGKAIAFQSDVR